MAKRINISNTFPKQAFWDMDTNKLSPQKDKAIIIPRVLMSTNEATFSKDIELVETVYSANEIYTTLKDTKERISNNVCRLVSKRYNKPTFLRYDFS
ncbi:MAG: hypothetical protein ACI9SD_001344 [Pseudohongiellaceae bacterium]